MSLTFRIHCEFPPPPRARWARADFQELKKEARRELRELANQFRKDLRAAAPKHTRKLARSLRVKPQRGGRDAIVFDIYTPVFYAAASNARGRSRGWWTGEQDHNEDSIERAIRDIQAAAARIIAQERVWQAVQRARIRAAAFAPALAGAALRGTGSRRRRGGFDLARAAGGAINAGYILFMIVEFAVTPP